MNYKEIMSNLIACGYECYKVGGCVRNELLQVRVTDVDLVTSATPKEIKEVFNNHVVTCGNSFLVTLVDGIEVATYRTDKADHAEVAHTLEEDLKRRDYTINAIAETVDGLIVDPLKGAKDLEVRLLRAVGNPIDRFIEDPVRIIRGLRFAALYSLEIHYKTVEAMRLCVPLLKNVPRERFRLELKKALSSTTAYEFLQALLKYGIFYDVFPSLSLLIKDGGPYHAETVIEHALLTVKNLDEIGNDNWLLKIAGLYHDIGKHTHEVDETGQVHFPMHDKLGTEYIIQDLHALHGGLTMSVNEVNYVIALKNLHMYCLGDKETKVSKKAVRRLVSRLKEANIPLKDWFLLRYVDKKSNLRHADMAWANYRKKYGQMLACLKDFKTFSIKDLTVDGYDVMHELGLSQGKEVGMVLKDMFDMVQNEQIENNRDALIGYLRRAQEINEQDGE